MAKKARNRMAGKSTFSGKVVPVNPWIPAVPVKGKGVLRLVLAVPLAVMAGNVSAAPLPTRTLVVPVELSRQAFSMRAFDEKVLPHKNQILRKFEDKLIFVAQGGKK